MDETMRILKMIEEKTITSEQGAALLEAMQSPTENALLEEGCAYDRRLLRVSIEDKEDKVSIQLPVKAIKGILNISQQLPVLTEKLEGVNLPEVIDAVLACTDAELNGDLVNITSADGTVVRIFVE